MRRKGGARTPSLNDVDLSLRLEPAVYDKKLAQVQLTLTAIQQAYLLSGRSAVIVFEGWDAAGKGGTIRRTSAAFDPRSFKVWPIGPPRNYYLARLYLLRFMERLPPAGAITAFDRSWYGRVLVERVEELIPLRQVAQPGLRRHRYRAGRQRHHDLGRASRRDAPARLRRLDRGAAQRRRRPVLRRHPAILLQQPEEAVGRQQQARAEGLRRGRCWRRGPKQQQQQERRQRKEQWQWQWGQQRQWEGGRQRQRQRQWGRPR